MTDADRTNQPEPNDPESSPTERPDWLGLGDPDSELSDDLLGDELLDALADDPFVEDAFWDDDEDDSDDDSEEDDEEAKLDAAIEAVFAAEEVDDEAIDPEDADALERVTDELYQRIGESAPQPRLEATRRVMDLLGDPQTTYPVIHITGTNGKTSTARMIEAILRTYGIRPGTLTSPHLVGLNERIRLDGRSISGRSLEENWLDIKPYIELVDAELVAAGEAPLTFFEALTALAFAAFADAPVDVAVLEVGMGGEWDSTNVADAQVAVLTPIALDHERRLGATVAEIAATKAGIIKPASEVVSAQQVPPALGPIERAVELSEATLRLEGHDFSLISTSPAVGGQVIDVQGLAGEYSGLFLSLFGEHQAHNAAVAIAAVEAFLGRGEQQLDPQVLAEALGSVTSPGRLQLISDAPPILVDAAHNPHGALSLTAALGEHFAFAEVAIVFGVLDDKNVEGIVAALAPAAARFIVTASASERSIEPDVLTERVLAVVPQAEISTTDTLADALDAAVAWSQDGVNRGIVVTGSITLVGEALDLAALEGWQS